MTPNQKPKHGVEHGLLLRLQARSDEGEENEDYLQYLLFTVASKYYGIDILEIHEILKPVPLTRLPNVRPDVLGVVNLRGNIIPVIDLQKKFFAKYTELSEASRIIVGSYQKKNVGILVANIEEVARIHEDQLEAVQMEQISEQHIKGAARSKEKVFLIINLGALFSDTQGAV